MRTFFRSSSTISRGDFSCSSLCLGQRMPTLRSLREAARPHDLPCPTHTRPPHTYPTTAGRRSSTPARPRSLPNLQPLLLAQLNQHRHGHRPLSKPDHPCLLPWISHGRLRVFGLRRQLFDLRLPPIPQTPARAPQQLDRQLLFVARRRRQPRLQR